MPKVVEIYFGHHMHAAQEEIRRSRAINRVAACGRRFGKTDLSKAEGGEVAGNGGRVGYSAPTNKMMVQVWEDVKRWLQPAIADKDEQMRRLELYGGGIWEFWSLDNPDGPRGREYDLFILDECAMLPSSYAWEAVIQPTLLNRKGRALFLSTPRGLNWLWELWLRGRKKPGVVDEWPNWASFQFPTVSNPTVDPTWVAEMRRTTTAQHFAQEYLAQFMADETAVFRNLDKCTMKGFAEYEAGLPGHAYAIGWDVARKDDFSVMTVIDLNDKRVVKIDRANHLSFELQLNRLRSLNERFWPFAILVEDNANLKLIEDCQRMGLPVVPFRTTNISKSMLVDALSLAFEREELLIPDDDILIGELQAYTTVRTPTGLIRYQAPENMHDDHVMSLMLAYWVAAGETTGEAALYSFSGMGDGSLASLQESQYHGLSILANVGVTSERSSP